MISQNKNEITIKFSFKLIFLHETMALLKDPSPSLHMPIQEIQSLALISLIFS
jgi:hypothetical protein